MQNPILISGANKRVGYYLTKALVEQGYQVLAIYREDPGQLTELNGVTPFKADLTKASERNKLIKFIQVEATALRGIIHNASVWLDDSLQNLETMYQIHIAAPFHINEALAEQLKASPRSDIIHICDDSASRGSKNHIAYAATKAALLNMTLSFAEKFAPHVRVNAISPGLLIFKEDSQSDYQSTALRKALLQYEPGATPLTQAVLYLLESQYSTGSNIVINGGRHLKRITE